MRNSRDIDALRSDVAANCRVWLELCKAAGLAVLAGVFAGFSWSLSMGIAALGFGLDSLWDALASMQAARG